METVWDLGTEGINSQRKCIEANSLNSCFDVSTQISEYAWRIGFQKTVVPLEAKVEGHLHLLKRKTCTNIVKRCLNQTRV
jgi:hypothetical protein